MHEISVREKTKTIHMTENNGQTSIRDIIAATGFRFHKGLGQNFLTDKNLLAGIVKDSGVQSDELAVEIGTGAGTLTRALAETAKRVISFEVDASLAPVLDLSLKGVENAEVIFKDVLKMREEEIAEITGEEFRLVANLPYYITTPLIMKFVESELPVKSLTVMVQKEVADRIVAKVGEADYSSITLAVQMAGNANITRIVSRKMFFPSPNVDSAVVHIEMDRSKLEGEDRELVHKLVRSAFAMRRKTLANNLAAAFGYAKAQATELVAAAGLDPQVRGEALSLDDFVRLSHLVKELARS